MPEDNVVDFAAFQRLDGKETPPEQMPALASLISQAPRPVTFSYEALCKAPAVIVDTKGKSTTSIMDLWKDLEPGSDSVPKLAAPRKQIVRGVFFGAHLLYPGWWTRGTASDLLRSGDWKAGETEVANIRRWLNTGYELWGPSWDIWNPEDDQQFLFGQMGDGHGDEVDSLHVIVAPEAAQRLKKDMGSRLAVGVVAQGTLYHDSLVRNGIAEGARKALDRTVDHGSWRMGYYLVIHDIEPNRERSFDFIDIDVAVHQPKIYSAYIWQCLIDSIDEKDGREGKVSLPKVIFIWEHTNLLSKDCLVFHAKSLARKKQYMGYLVSTGSMRVLQNSFSLKDFLSTDEYDPPLVDGALLSEKLAEIRRRFSPEGRGPSATVHTLARPEVST